MKLIDEKGRLLGLLNIVDILIIVFAIIVFFAGYKMLGTLTSESVSTGKKIIRLEMTQKRDSFYESIEIGDEIFEKVNNVYYGTVLDKSRKPAEVTTTSWDTGELKHVNIPEKYDVTLTLEIEGDKDVAIGQILSVKAKSFTGYGYIVGLEEAE